YRAMQRLLASPERAVAVLQTRLKPVAAVDTRRIERCIAELDSDDFKVRQRAMKELETLGELAEPAMQKALGKKPPLDVTRRLERLLDQVANAALPADTLRQIRAIEVLESLATPAADRLLERLAGGAPEARQTKEAKAVLARVMPVHSGGPTGHRRR